jgi:hypothetical protein
MSVGTTKRKSIALTQDEFASLKKYAEQFNTGIECAESIGIHRNVLDRVLIVGSGSPETIYKIRLILRANA